MRETGFWESEYDVLNDNDIINRIKKYVPAKEFNAELKLNNYKLYAKSYSNFAQKC